MLNYNKKKIRKKGSLMIEQLLIMPILVISVWMIIQLILFTYTNSQMNAAADDAATSISHHLRGNPELVNLNSDEPVLELTNLSNADSYLGVGFDRIKRASESNTFIGLGGIDNDDVSTNNSDFFGKTPEKCQELFKAKGNSQALCVYLEKDTGGTDTAGSFQVVVRAKAPFNIIGNFLPFTKDENGISKIYLYGNSSAPIDMPGRFQYN